MEKALEKKLKAIFGIPRVDFALPGDAQEQDTLFVAIDRDRVTVQDTIQHHQVRGIIRMFADQAKMPHGFFARCIANAKPEDSKSIFFTELDESAGTYREIDVRSMGFVFFHDSQYDPDKGIINQIDVTVEVQE